MMMKMMMIVSPTVSQAKPYSPSRPSTEKAISALLKVTSSYLLPHYSDILVTVTKVCPHPLSQCKTLVFEHHSMSISLFERSLALVEQFTRRVQWNGCDHNSIWSNRCWTSKSLLESTRWSTTTSRTTTRTRRSARYTCCSLSSRFSPSTFSLNWIPYYLK